MSDQDVRAQMSQISQRWRSGDTALKVTEGGESPECVVKRLLPAVKRALRPGQTTLLVCHSHVNKALIASVAPGLSLSELHSIAQRNCAVNVLDYTPAASPVSNHGFDVRAVDLTARAKPRI